jgi:arabinogalactan endo-1,4-beta-galactosidase
MTTLKSTYLFLFLALAPISLLTGQEFYFGNDLSYVNEMEDCGVVYRENGVAKDPYEMFAEHGGNLVRLRFWHTPAWYDTLNAGQRYSDFQDVKKSIGRAKDAGMQVLLDFHLSDNWADPGKQLVPAAWLGVVDDLPLLKDSLHNYIFQTLMALHAGGLLPEMVQIGNETNKGILLSPEDNQVWTLDWERNAQLFNTAIQAVRDVEDSTGAAVKVALHVAGPADAGWLLEGFTSHGVTDFDIIGISYYWAWHQPTTIEGAGNVIAALKQAYPGRAVMIFETGYIWTWENNDNANNIINAVHPDYAPPSPENQKKWLVDLTKAVMANGGAGVIYWEPAWVSSTCFTQWGQGSHQEHATFFDFENNLLPDGGMFWMSYNYATPASERTPPASFRVSLAEGRRTLRITLVNASVDSIIHVSVFDAASRLVVEKKLEARPGTPLEFRVSLPVMAVGVYSVALSSGGILMGSEKFVIVASK